MLSMVLDLVAQGETRPLRLIYGYRHERECGFDEGSLRSRPTAFRSSASSVPPSPSMSRCSMASPTGHICGPPAMIEALQAQAKTLELSPLLTEPYFTATCPR